MTITQITAKSNPAVWALLQPPTEQQEQTKLLNKVSAPLTAAELAELAEPGRGQFEKDGEL